MSRIALVEPHALRLPAEIPGGREEEIFLLRIVTEDGTEGWGEAHGSAYLARAVIEAPVTHVTSQGLRAILLGQEVDDVPRLRRLMEKGTQWIGRDGVVMQAIAAAELALWDIAGKQAGLPVAQLLGAAAGALSLAVYASAKVGADPQATHDRIVWERAAGYTAHKIGWPPFGALEATDVAFVEAARDAAPDAMLMVDAAQAYDLETALSRAKAFERFDLAWIEEPMDRDDLVGQARLLRESVLPIASGEGECGLPGLLRIAERVHVLQPDITRCGVIAAMAAGRRVTRVCSHTFTTAFNAVIHGHVLAAMESGWMLEWPLYKVGIWQEVFPAAPVIGQGRLTLPEAPGWGLVPDPAALERLAVTPEGRSRA